MTQEEKDARKAIHAHVRKGIAGLEAINKREETTMIVPTHILARVPDEGTAETLIGLLDCWFGAHWYTQEDTEEAGTLLLLLKPNSAGMVDQLREEKARYFCIGYLHGMKGDK